MDSAKKKKVLEKFATTLLECTLTTNVKIGKTYKVEVSDDGFTVRKRRQKSEDGMHFRYDVVESYQANQDGDQFVLKIAPTKLGSAGGFFRLKTKEAAKIVALASRLSVVAAVRKEALSRTASGASVPSSPRSPARMNSSGSPSTPLQNGGPASGSSPFSTSQQSIASGTTLPSSPASASNASTAKGGSSQELNVAPQKGGSPGVTPPKWTLSPTPYAAAKSAEPSPQKAAADSAAERGGSAEKRALAEALRKELRRSNDSSLKGRTLFARQSSFDAASADGGERAQTSLKPPSAGSSKASSPKGSESEQSGAWASDEGFRVSGRSSDEGARVSARLSDEGVRVSSRLSQGSSPSVSRQSSVKSVYSRQSSAGSRADAAGPGGIRLLPRVGSNPFLAVPAGEDPAPGSRPASSLPPPPTSPKKGVFEGFEQFIKVATPRASSEGSRRSSANVTSDISRRTSDVSASGGSQSPIDLLNGGEDDSCAPPLVIEICPRKEKAPVSRGSKWQGLDAEVPPGTWALPEVGVEWLDASPISSPPARADSTVPVGSEILGTSPTHPTTWVTQGANQVFNPGSPGANSAHTTVTNPFHSNGLGEEGNPQANSPAGNPFRVAYPDPFIAAFGSIPAPVVSAEAKPVRTKSTNPFAEPSSADFPESFAAGPQVPMDSTQQPSQGNRSQIIASPLLTDGREPSFAPITARVKQSDSNPLSTQNGRYHRSLTEPPNQKQPGWEPFSVGNNPSAKPVKPVLTRSVTDPYQTTLDRSLSSTECVSSKGFGDAPGAWEPFYTEASVNQKVPAVKSASAAAVAGATVGNANPDGWEAFGRR